MPPIPAWTAPEWRRIVGSMQRVTEKVLGIVLIAVGMAASIRGADDPSSTRMRQRIETFAEDLGALGRFFNFNLASNRAQRLEAFFRDTRRALDEVDYEALGPDERIDFALFDAHLEERLAQLEYDRAR